MKFYHLGKWDDCKESDFGLTERNFETHSFEDYLSENVFNTHEVYRKGEMPLDCSIYYNRHKDIYLGTWGYHEEYWGEFIIPDGVSLMLFIKEFDQFFSKTEEWVMTNEGEFIRTSAFQRISHTQNSEDKYAFEGTLPDGEIIQLMTVSNRGYYLRNNFGIDYYV